MAEDKMFTITASAVVTATFEIYAEDEDDARFQVEDIRVSLFDAIKTEQDDWDILEINAKG